MFTQIKGEKFIKKGSGGSAAPLKPFTAKGFSPKNSFAGGRFYPIIFILKEF
ncbi:MAG: hypothetical protein ABIN94_09825 [Ferruginibacter sp.]